MRVVKNITAVVICVLLVIRCADAQQPQVVDSLSSVLEKTTADSTRIEVLLALSAQYENLDNGKCMDYLTTALEIANRSGNKAQQPVILRNMAQVHISAGEMDKASSVLFKSIRLSEELEEWEGTGSAYIMLGRIYMEKGSDRKSTEKAMSYFLKSLEALNKSNRKDRVATVLNNIGTTYGAMGQDSTAIQYFLQSLKIREEIKDEYGIASTLSNLGLVYNQRKEYDKALSYQMKSLDIRIRLNDKRTMANSMNNIGDVYALKKEYDKAVVWLNKGLSLAREIGNKNLEKNSYEGLMEVYEAKRNFAQALLYARKFEELKDVMLNAESEEQIQELETKYETAKKEQTIQNLTRDKLSKETEIQRRKTINTSVLLASLVVSIILFFTYRLYRQKENANKRLQELGKEKNEFLTIAAHDLKNPLQTIIGYCQMQSAYFDKLSKEKILKHTTNIEITSSRMLELISNLLDINAIEQGRVQVTKESTELQPLLERIKESMQNQAGQKSITLELDNRSDKTFIYTDIFLLRQVLENLLSNAVKYTPVNGHVRLWCNNTADGVEIGITDSGPGIPEDEQQKLFQKFTKLSTRPTAGESSHGLGLSIVKKLSDLLEAKVTFHSEQDKGSTFKITLA